MSPSNFTKRYSLVLLCLFFYDILAYRNIGYDQTGAAPHFPLFALHWFLGD